MKRVYDYDNYRDFLKAAYADLKSRQASFSFRYFSRMAGFKSSSVLKLVMDGKRNLSAEAAAKFARALKLNKEETFFFRPLVALNQAKTLEERRLHAESLIHSRTMRQLYPLAVSQFHYYQYWYYVPVRELVGLPGFQEDPAWIARTISPAITPAEAAEALETLLKLRLVRREESGRLVQTAENVSTGDEVNSTAIHLWHMEMLKRAAESVDRHRFEDIDISAVTVGVAPDTVPRLNQMIAAMRKAILEECSKDPAPQRVYQVSIQMFPLSEAVVPGDS